LVGRRVLERARPPCTHVGVEDNGEPVQSIEANAFTAYAVELRKV
jgi:hypothetical protein